ncbi:amp dependent CoA ligase [Crucibulum laeve]|uniref:Amp dependent CoA ligase n=1 Tax=Crucibulum laeve TaxID=68775 RepID=A0A5C3LUQ0_9AGAR|nr:amp dependent CoA ligase [Crucibulum laeve]
MAEFQSPVQLPHIPDNLTIPQFILDIGSRQRPQRMADTPFFVEDATGRQIHFPEVHKRTSGLANALHRKWRIGTSDVVCLFSPNHIDYPIAIWAVHSLGGIITPANPSYTVEELIHQLNLTKSVMMIIHPSSLGTALKAAEAVGLAEDRIITFNQIDGLVNSTATVDELIAFGLNEKVEYKAQRLEPGEGKTKLAFLSFSSGTTGRPKAVEISHYAVIANVIQTATHYRVNDPLWKEKRMNPGDVGLAVLPFFHIYGLVVILHYLLFCGMSLVIVPKFNFPRFLRSIVLHRVSHLYLVPPQVVLLCKNPAAKDYNLDGIKFCNSGGAPLSGDLMKQLTQILPNAVIGQGYGLTETCTTVSSIPPDRRLGVIGAAGQLLPGLIARVVKEDGTLAAEGEQGELIVKGPSMALGYFNNLEATKETFVNGWVHTGDEVMIKDLQVYVVDRLKEIMKVRGFQVAPAELEGHLLLHPDVADACVVGVPDDYSGEVPLAFIVPTPSALNHIIRNATEANTLKRSIAKHVSEVKISYKWLKGGVEFVDAIPKNPSGKILRRILRDRAREMVKKGRLEAKL